MTQWGKFEQTGEAVIAAGEEQVVLAPGVYDLRCSAAYLAEEDGHRVQYGVTASFRASFARATRSLVRHGALVRLYVVPVARFIVPRGSTRTSFHWPSAQLRFVTLSANPVGLTLRGNRPGDLYME